MSEYLAKKFIYNRKDRKEKRSYLRKQTTEAEKLLWSKINRKRLGFVFKRQYSVGPYFVDFYCPVKRIVIELDGSHHNNEDQKKYDEYRTEYLESLDIKVIRFWDDEVFKNLDGVIEMIYKKLHGIDLPIE